jgi:hypothetical protein
MTDGNYENRALWEIIRNWSIRFRVKYIYIFKIKYLQSWN